MTDQLKRHKRKRRIRSKVQGTAEKPRLTVYKANQYNYAQLINDETGEVVVEANDIKNQKGTKTESAKKVGEELAKLAKKEKIETCVFDRNGFIYHGRVKAIAEGAREGGLKF